MELLAARRDDRQLPYRQANEHQGKPLIFGVQFHPGQMLVTEPRMKAVFMRFVQEARAVRLRTGGEQPGGPPR